MPDNNRVMTAPIAIIKINSVAVGKMKNVRITETIRRGRVTGIGTLTPSELPALEWNGTMSCSSYSINFNLLNNVSRIGTFRQGADKNTWQNAVLMQEDGLQIDVMRKVKDGQIDPETGLVQTKYEVFATVKGAFANREGFDIQEGQISGRDTDFEYLEPILFNE